MLCGYHQGEGKLYLLNADSRMLFGSTSRNRPSRFSLEIPLDLINKPESRTGESRIWEPRCR